MSLLHRSIFLVFLVVIQGCGFTPVYEDKSDSNINLQEILQSVNVKPIDFGRAGQKLQTRLEKLLHQEFKTVQPKYSLSIKLKRKREALIIEQDREITRYNLVLTANYRLIDLKSGIEVYKEKSKMVGSFNTVKSDFATFAVEEDTLGRISEEMANEIKLRLSSFFLSK